MRYPPGNGKDDVGLRGIPTAVFPKATGAVPQEPPSQWECNETQRLNRWNGLHFTVRVRIFIAFHTYPRSIDIRHYPLDLPRHVRVFLPPTGEYPALHGRMVGGDHLFQSGKCEEPLTGLQYAVARLGSGANVALPTRSPGTPHGPRTRAASDEETGMRSIL